MNEPQPIQAAGAVVWREGDEGVEVVLIHRPKYDDWSFPKGKLDPGEHVLTAAVREVAEETGLEVRLGVPLGSQGYRTDGTAKQVHYWSARRVGGPDDFTPNHEVDDLVWEGLDHARSRLSHAHDGEILDRFAASPYRSTPLLVLRHGHARSRESWQLEDIARPLNEDGERQALALVPLLRAYGVRRVLTSDAARCVDTVEPFAAQSRVDLECSHRWSEEGLDLTELHRRADQLLMSDTPTVLCSHRPVLPKLFAALGIDDPQLEPGAFVVVHHHEGTVRATERQAT